MHCLLLLLGFRSRRYLKATQKVQGYRKPPKVEEEPPMVPTPAPLTRREIAGDFLKEHPLAWILPLTGVAHGLFTNMVPISGGLLLMPLFQELEVTKSSAATLALSSLIQSVSNGFLGWFM